MNNIGNNIFNNNIIKGEINIEEEDINKEIQIINVSESNKKKQNRNTNYPTLHFHIFGCFFGRSDIFF